jgi:hypothetical protein
MQDYMGPLVRHGGSPTADQAGVGFVVVERGAGKVLIDRDRRRLAWYEPRETQDISVEVPVLVEAGPEIAFDKTFQLCNWGSDGGSEAGFSQLLIGYSFDFTGIEPESLVPVG